MGPARACYLVHFLHLKFFVFTSLLSLISLVGLVSWTYVCLVPFFLFHIMATIALLIAWTYPLSFSFRQTFPPLQYPLTYLEPAFGKAGVVLMFCIRLSALMAKKKGCVIFSCAQTMDLHTTARAVVMVGSA